MDLLDVARVITLGVCALLLGWVIGTRRNYHLDVLELIAQDKVDLVATEELFSAYYEMEETFDRPK